MALVIESKQGISFTDIQAATKVGLYLAGAVEAMGKTSSKREAARAADKYLADHPVKNADKQAALKIIGNMEKELSGQAKTADFKTKAQYALGGKEAAKAVMLGAASVVTGVMAAQGVDPMAAVSFTLFAGALSTGAYAFSEEAKKDKSEALKAYTEIKHSQIALKKLKNALDPKPSYKDEVRALYASGLGNPGGMITALNLKKQNGGR
ncbi:MAG: hypothetical protein IJY17_02015 [Alphaproteobacteria bacterium]|nr:hypothetical protein [Alphaproteobacteria bacterium]